MDKQLEDVQYGISKYNNSPGVICYMNSIIAILQQTPIFADYILTAQFRDKLLDKHENTLEITNSILFQLYNLLNISHIYDNYTINPETFREKISKKDSMWGKSQHQDSQEFLTFLLNNVEEEIAEKVVFIPGQNIVEITKNAASKDSLEDHLIKIAGGEKM